MLHGGVNSLISGMVTVVITLELILVFLVSVVLAGLVLLRILRFMVLFGCIMVLPLLVINLGFVVVVLIVMFV